MKISTILDHISDCLDYRYLGKLCARALEQAMLQKVLTGRTRLI